MENKSKRYMADEVTAGSMTRLLEEVETVVRRSIGIHGRPVLISKKSPRQITVTKVRKLLKILEVARVRYFIILSFTVWS